MRKHYDAILVGGGIMSSTLAVLLNELDPTLRILVIEKNKTNIEESTGGMNNAGTGHQGFCELNYTPMDEDGNIDIKKAIKVCESFEKSKQLWSYLKDKGHIGQEFINSVPHMSVVHGQENVNFLKKRYTELKKVCLFSEMEFSEDFDEISTWAPLITKGRDKFIPIAATRMKRGTDIDFGQLASDILWRIPNVDVLSNQMVIDINRSNKIWFVRTSNKQIFTSDFVFIGAGGATLPLLQKTEIPEASQYGGFPVSGQWLVCDNPEVVKLHKAKVYGKPSIGAPPMSVPHLDTRYVDGKKVLLFGPYAGFSTKFLKGGSWLDLVKSITLKNIGTMLSAGARNIPLTKYLIKEIFRSKKGKFDMLKEYYPEARPEDWKLSIAGQRVQVIKNVDGKGTIEFGTEIVTSADGTLAALLGASPGASTSVKVMIDIIEKCFKEKMPQWKAKLDEMIPSHSKPLHEDPLFYQEIEDYTSKTLGLYKGNGMRYMSLLNNEPMKYEPEYLIKIARITKKK